MITSLVSAKNNGSLSGRIRSLKLQESSSTANNNSAERFSGVDSFVD